MIFEPLPNNNFSCHSKSGTRNGLLRVLAKALKRPFLFPLFEWQLKLLFGKGSKVITQSVSVIPKFLIDDGFVFDFPDIESALLDLINNKYSV